MTSETRWPMLTFVLLAALGAGWAYREWAAEREREATAAEAARVREVEARANALREFDRAVGDVEAAYKAYQGGAQPTPPEPDGPLDRKAR